MDGTVSQSGLLPTDHFVPLWTETEWLLPEAGNDSCVASTANVSGASASL